jgi:hypothetical protein
MIPDQLKPFVPDGLQSVKQLVTYGANLFFALFMVQVLGLDLTRYGISPVIDWRMAGGLFVVFALAQSWIGNRQEARLHEKIAAGTGTGSQPPLA